MKNIIFILAIVGSITSAQGQQDLILTKYTFNSMFFNPAYAGSTGEDQGTVLINYRDQWMGLEGSPTTMMLGGEVNLFEDRVGLGMSLARESIGIESRIDLLTNYAYRMDLGDSYFTAGLRVGFHFFRSKLNEVDYSDPLDNIYDLGDVSFNVLSVGAGIYYYQENFYAGLSVPALATMGDEAAFKSRHIYLHTGALIDLNEDSDMQLEPSILLKYEPAVPLQFTLGVQLWLNKDLAIGTHYRSVDAFALSMEFIISDRLSIGAAYDFTTSELRYDHSGTLEMLVGYKFGYDRDYIPMGRR